MTRALLLPALLAGSFASSSAHACGGFFCNSSAPVFQNAERIAFGIDARGMAETHVQIFYEGPSDAFAWVVPVPNNPEIFLSSDQLFNTLAFQLAPTFRLRWVEEGTCTEPLNLSFGMVEMSVSMDSAAPRSASTQGGVAVVQQGQVGPYDMAVLTAESTGELLTWLGDNGYDLPPALDPVLAPYVADHAHFLALKLQKDKDAGDIAPIGFRYAGSKPAIPIQLTSIAATPDMRLETYVFGAHRAVPESYLHVKINEAAVDWWSGGSNYPDVITLAADEAGGHAFATDFAGSPAPLRGQLYDPQRFDLDALRSAPDFGALIDRVQEQGWAATPQLQNALLACVDAPSDAAPNDFLNCPECYDWNEASFDAAACTDVLEVGVVEPLRRAEALFEHAWVSRMTSSLDAAEMTVDPVFVMNPDMRAVDNVHRAKFVYECTGGKRREKAMRRLDLADGRSILIPSERWMEDNRTDPFRYIEDLTAINAAIIEETGASGDPNVLTDLTADLLAQVESHNQATLRLMGCGCATTGSTGGAWAVGLAALGLIRRRRQ